MGRPSQAIIDLAALRHNVNVAKQLAPRSRMVAVVKANAYGHGAVTIGQALQPLVDALAVSCIEEASELRYAGITAPILLLQGVGEPTDLITAAELGLWVTVASEQQLGWLEKARLPTAVRCWLKVNTGMNRLGVSADSAYLCLQRLLNCRNVVADVVTYTHLAAAEDLQSKQTERQLAAFDALNCSTQRSAANSAALIAWPAAHYDWVRPGYMLYGNSPMSEDRPSSPQLQPVMTLSSSVIAVRNVETGESVGYGSAWIAKRPSQIATVTIGYGDGYPRHAVNGTPVLVNGQRAALAGRVSMDMIMVDVTDLNPVRTGDEVMLWGPGLPVAEVARNAGTVGYELMARMPARTPRVVRDTHNKALKSSA
ncbi:MAG: alanine racemase [Halioglobus sp.]|nr:alanine racemase [Halioglobus sp.]